MKTEYAESERFREWLVQQIQRRKADLQRFQDTLRALDNLPADGAPQGGAPPFSGNGRVSNSIKEPAPATIKEAMERIGQTLPDFSIRELWAEICKRYAKLKCSPRSMERPTKELLEENKIEVAKKNIGNIHPTRYRWKMIPQNEFKTERKENHEGLLMAGDRQE